MPKKGNFFKELFKTHKVKPDEIIEDVLSFLNDMDANNNTWKTRDLNRESRIESNIHRLKKRDINKVMAFLEDKLEKIQEKDNGIETLQSDLCKNLIRTCENILHPVDINSIEMKPEPPQYAVPPQGGHSNTYIHNKTEINHYAAQKAAAQKVADGHDASEHEMK